MKRKGFTILELLVSIFIISVISSIVLFNFPKIRQNFNINAFSEELFQDLKYTKQLAISGGSASININYALTGGGTGYRITNSSGVVKKEEKLPDRLSLTYTLSGSTITFNANGSCDLSGTITISTASTGRSKTITITSSTGMITMN